uniref:Uncharacterized protein n=1 Tax=Ditylenchus dipsaci TaxID=166011 RepID=A0A915DM62_9BILA
MEEIFDFNRIKNFVSGGTIKILVDSMHGVTGPYVSTILVDKLGSLHPPACELCLNLTLVVVIPTLT